MRVVWVDKMLVGFGTGYFASWKRPRASKVHVLRNGWVICGAKFAEDMAYQFCALYIHLDYVDCKTCRKIVMSKDYEFFIGGTYK